MADITWNKKDPNNEDTWTFKDKEGNEYTRWSMQGSKYDASGNLKRDAEKNIQKKQDETKAAGMTGVSKNVIPQDPSVQQQLVKDTAKEFNTSEKKAADIAGRVTGGNASIPAMSEPIKVDSKVDVGTVDKDAPAAKANDISNYEGVAKEIDDYKNIVDKIEDYYKDSIGSGLDDLSARDKKILALEHIGTTMKNLAKMQPYLGSIYGRQHEEVGPGDEKSMLQNVVETNLKGGLERRNKRMSAALDQQIKVSNFPSDLKMKMSEIANANNLDFYQKKRLIDVEIQKYAKQAGIDLNMYGKKAGVDVETNRQMLENAANRPYRLTGGIKTPIGGVGVE